MHRAPQLLEALGERCAEAPPLPLEEVIRIGLEELQVVLEDPVAVTELVGVLCRAGETRHMGGHLHERVVRDGEHLEAVRDCHEVLSRFRKCRPPFIRVEGVADADPEQRVDREGVPQPPPDVTSFLCRDGREQIDRERRSGDRGFNRGVERLLEPGEVVSCWHDRLTSAGQRS